MPKRVGERRATDGYEEGAKGRESLKKVDPASPAIGRRRLRRVNGPFTPPVLAYRYSRTRVGLRLTTTSTPLPCPRQQKARNDAATGREECSRRIN